MLQKHENSGILTNWSPKSLVSFTSSMVKMIHKQSLVSKQSLTEIYLFLKETKYWYFQILFKWKRKQNFSTTPPCLSKLEETPGFLFLQIWNLVFNLVLSESQDPPLAQDSSNKISKSSSNKSIKPQKRIQGTLLRLPIQGSTRTSRMPLQELKHDTSKSNNMMLTLIKNSSNTLPPKILKTSQIHENSGS